MVHRFSPADTIFLFPEELRREQFRINEINFEHASKWMNRVDEQKIFDDKANPRCIRLIYSRSLDSLTYVIRIEKTKLVIKEIGIGQEGLNSHYDATLLTTDERMWLEKHKYYKWLIKNHKEDSSKAIGGILAAYPDIESNDKQIYLKEYKGSSPNADSIIYTEKSKLISENVIIKILDKIDDSQFWTLNLEYYEAVMDGSGFSLEVKNGNKYKIVNCSNCKIKSLIDIRNELLKFTNLKEDEIY